MPSKEITIRQTLYDGYLVIFALAQAVILLMLTPLFTGISRQIRARMHSRRGPGIWQDYRDIHKLFKRQEVAPISSGLMFRLMPWVLISSMLALALALAGMPPFNIFLSEFMTITAGLARNHLLIIVLLLLLLTLVLAGLVRMAARVLMAKPPQAVNRGDLGWLTTSPMVILLVMMLAMGTHIPQPVIRILAGASTIVLSGTHDLPAQRSTWHDFLPSGTASVSEKHSER